MFKTISVLLIALFGITAQAQMMGQTQWGSGQWGGTQGCSYPQQSPQGMGGPQGMGQGGNQVSEEVKEISAQLAEAKKQIKTKKSEKQRLDRDLERTREDVNGLISEDYSSFIFEHIENNRQCREYKGYNNGQAAETPAESMTPIQSFSVTQWSQYCDANKAGGVLPSVCDASAFRHGERGSSAAECKKGLSEYRKGYHQSQKLQSEVDRLTRNVERLNDQLKQAKADAKEMQKEGGSRQAQTEGDFCLECARSGNGYAPQQSQTNWGNVAANVGVGLAAMYMGYKSNQMVTDANASIGMPTPYLNSSWSYGLPYLQQGIYGALNSNSGQGSFGCGGSSGGMNASMNGAFGYPQSMMGGMSGMNGSMGLSMNSPVMMQYQMQQQQQYQSMLQYQQMYQQQILSMSYRNYSPYTSLYGTTGYAGGVTSGSYYNGYSGPGTPLYSSGVLGNTGYTSSTPGTLLYYSGSSR